MENPGVRPQSQGYRPSAVPPWAVQQQAGRQLDPTTGRPRVFRPDPNAPSAGVQAFNTRQQQQAQQFQNPGVMGANAYAAQVLGDYAAKQKAQAAGVAGANAYAGREMDRIAAAQKQAQAASAGANNYAILEMLRIQQEAMKQNPNGAL